MKTKPLICCLTVLFVFLLFGSTGFAQLFGGSDASHEHINSELKKLNTRLVEKLFPELGGVKKTQSDLVEQMKRLNESTLKRHNQLVRQVELLNSSLASLQGSIEQIQVTNHKADAKLDREMTQVRTQMNSLESGLAGSFQALQKGLAQDMDRLGQAQEQRIGRAVSSVGELATLQKKNGEVMVNALQSLNKNDETLMAGVTRMEAGQKGMQEKNQKLIEILSENFKQQQVALVKIDELSARQQSTKQDIELTRETMKKLKEIIDKRLAETAQTQESLRTMNQQALKQTEVMQGNLLVFDEKMNKLAAGLKTLDAQNTTSKQQLETANQKLDQVRTLNQQTDEKFAKLVDTTKSMLVTTNQVGEKMDQVAQKIDVSRSEANLSNEKISKLVDILKTIAQEQDKLTQVLGNQGKINQNIQAATDAIQATISSNLTETHKEFRDRLEDLRRKGNVAISRGDDILKLLQK